MTKKRKYGFMLDGSQWLGLLILLLIIVAACFTVRLLKKNISAKSDSEALVLDSTLAIAFNHSIVEQRQTYYQHKKDTIPLSLHPFDPNQADSVELLQLGFRPWMAKNMLKYRVKGGRYRSKEALRKVYGMTDELYSQIEPYIVISASLDTLSSDTALLSGRKYYYAVKKDTILEINTADTTALKLIRGIGSYTARQIVRYREQLGGFYSLDQLAEIQYLGSNPARLDNKPTRLDSIKQYFTVDTSLIVPLDVNHVKAERLARHPYLRYDQARAIYTLRREKFRLDNIRQIETLDEIDENDIIRLRPYLIFQK